MPEPNDIDDRLKIVETTLVSLGNKLDEWLHKIFEQVVNAATAVTLMKSQREKGVDITARVLAIIAIAASTAIGLVMWFHPTTITQDVKQETNVERPLSNDEHHQQEVERQIRILDAERREQSQ